jgi:hypothetical protein
MLSLFSDHCAGCSLAFEGRLETAIIRNAAGPFNIYDEHNDEKK